MTKQTIHQRVQMLIDASGAAVQAVSRAAGMDKETLRKFLANPQQRPSTRLIEGLVGLFNVDAAWLLNGRIPVQETERAAFEQAILGEAKKAYLRSSSQTVEDLVSGLGDEPSVFLPRSDATPATQAPPLPSRNGMPLDVPVMGTAAGSLARGAFQLEGGVVDYVRRPPALIGARDIYALYVEGSSMEPQYFPGDLIYVNPHKPPRIGDIVVVQCRNGEHTPEEASLGIYRKRTEKAVTIGKRNPVAEIDLSRDHVKDIHRVLTMNELFGV